MNKGTSDSADSPSGRTFFEAVEAKKAGRTRYVRTKVDKGITRRERADGTGSPKYDAQVWVNKKAVSKTFNRLQDARRWRDEMLGKRAQGEKIIRKQARMRMRDFMEAAWLTWLAEEVRLGNLRESTASWYRGGAKHVERELGRYRVVDIGKDELRAMLRRCVEAGDSGAMLRRIRATTRSILALAVEQGLIPSDPSGFMVGRNAPKKLKRTARPVKAWSQEEAQTFLGSVRGDRLEALWILLLTSGLRRGEALGLRWQDVDLTAGTITVSQQLIQVDGVPRITKPKTAKSQRTIAIGHRTVEALRQHRARQAAEQLAAEDWVDSGLVFTKPDGQWIRPDRCYVILRRLVEQAGVPWIGVHGLRHTMASIALQNGTDIATVSQRLGHADTSVTTRVYLHGSEETDRAAAQTLEEVLGG